MRKILLLFIFILSVGKNQICFSQQSKLDSLVGLSQIAKSDTEKINIWNFIAEEFRNNDPDTAFYFAKLALSLSEKTGFKIGHANAKLWLGTATTNLSSYADAIQYLSDAEKEYKQLLASAKSDKDKIKRSLARTYKSIGVVYYHQSEYSKALENYTSSLKTSANIGDKKMSDKKTIADTYNNIGTIYYTQGKPAEAYKNHINALKIRDSIGDKKGLAGSYNNIGYIEEDLKNYDEALKNYDKALKIRESIGDKGGADDADTYTNIGSVNLNLGNYTGALENYFHALNIQEKLKNKKGIAESYHNMGSVHKNKGEYPAALENYFKALSMQEEIPDKNGIAGTCISIGTILNSQNKIPEALKYLNRGLIISKEIEVPELIRDSYYELSDVYEKMNQPPQALAYYKLHAAIKDSLSNMGSSQQIENLKFKYQYEKDEKKRIADQEKKDTEIFRETQSKNAIIGFVTIGLLLAGIFSVFILNRWRITRKQKEIIEAQKQKADESYAIIEEQKKIVEEKNQSITDSINYASRIQTAMLIPEKEIYRMLHDFFILFKPKDIVSGDFYWYHTAPLPPKGGFSAGTPEFPPSGGRGAVFIAAADCTGHGVPGAFMSMLATEKLNEAIQQTTKPGEVLHLVNRGVKKSLHQSGVRASTHDGMDIALVRLDLQGFQNLEGLVTLQYAGANRPLWLIRNSEVIEYKATKSAMGGFTDENEIFQTHEIELQPEDTFYIFSDGYADQFSRDDKKLMTKKFKEILVSIQNKTMEDQKIYLNTFIENWKENTEQTDDILVIGVRI